MKQIRLLPIVVMAVAALLVFKTIGLVTNGAYVLTGTTMAQAASGAAPAAPAEGGAKEGEATMTLPVEPTMTDNSPTLADEAPTIATEAPDAAAAAGGGHGATAEPAAEAAAADHGAPAAEAGDAAAAGHGEAPVPEEGAPAAEHGAAPVASNGTSCVEVNATMTETPAEGDVAVASGAGFAQSMQADCLPSGDAVPMRLDSSGQTVPLISTDGSSVSEKQLLERLAARRTELETYEQDLALRASIVDAAEKRIAERAATLEALEAQISSLVDQRQEMESGQFAGIVAMYETMKPKDAANIFNNLDMNVLLRVAKSMSPRKMAPILAVMDAPRAQELTVKMAALADQPATEMTPEDLAALPQIVGQ